MRFYCCGVSIVVSCSWLCCWVWGSLRGKVRCLNWRLVLNRKLRIMICNGKYFPCILIHPRLNPSSKFRFTLFINGLIHRRFESKFFKILKLLLNLVVQSSIIYHALGIMLSLLLGINTSRFISEDWKLVLELELWWLFGLLLDSIVFFTSVFSVHLVRISEQSELLWIKRDHLFNTNVAQRNFNSLIILLMFKVLPDHWFSLICCHCFCL